MRISGDCRFVPVVIQRDSDADGLGDACDLEPFRPTGKDDWMRQSDADGDSWPDADDLCPWAYDRKQLDRDGDGLGDACDPDADGNDVLDVREARCFSSAWGLFGDCPMLDDDGAPIGVDAPSIGAPIPFYAPVDSRGG